MHKVPSSLKVTATPLRTLRTLSYCYHYKSFKILNTQGALLSESYCYPFKDFEILNTQGAIQHASYCYPFNTFRYPCSIFICNNIAQDACPSDRVCFSATKFLDAYTSLLKARLLPLRAFNIQDVVRYPFLQYHYTMLPFIATTINIQDAIQCLRFFL